MWGCFQKRRARVRLKVLCAVYTFTFIPSFLPTHRSHPSLPPSNQRATRPLVVFACPPVHPLTYSSTQSLGPPSIPSNGKEKEKEKKEEEEEETKQKQQQQQQQQQQQHTHTHTHTHARTHEHKLRLNS